MPEITTIEIDCATQTGSEIVENVPQEVIDAQNALLEEKRLAFEARQQEIASLKESAKAKLIAGQPLTEEEAQVIIF